MSESVDHAVDWVKELRKIQNLDNKAYETKLELLQRLMHMLDLVQAEIMAENDNYLPLNELNQLLIDLVKVVRDK